jgi:hypothetical protein
VPEPVVEPVAETRKTYFEYNNYFNT